MQIAIYNLQSLFLRTKMSCLAVETGILAVYLPDPSYPTLINPTVSIPDRHLPRKCSDITMFRIKSSKKTMRLMKIRLTVKQKREKRKPKLMNELRPEISNLRSGPKLINKINRMHISLRVDMPPLLSL